MTMTRKEFVGTMMTGAAALALLGACGDDSSTPDAAPSGPDAAAGSCTANGAKNGTISANHGHKLVIPSADVNGASMDRTYSIEGTATHDHQVTVTAAQFDMLKANTAGFSMTSTDGGAGHTHSVMVVCA